MGLSPPPASPPPRLPSQELDRRNLEIGDSQPGNYLSALIASADRDTLAAEVYYREALRADPRNPDLLERAFAAALSNGDETSATCARRTVACARSEQQPGAPLRWRFTISNKDNLRRARAHLASGDADARARCDDRLLTAWCYAGQSDLHHALDTIDRIRDPSVLAFRDYHAGLIANLLGNPRGGAAKAEVRV